MSVKLHGSVKWERDVERTPTACCSLAAHVSINAACVGDGVDSLHSRWQVVDVTSEPLFHVFSEAYAVRVEARAIQIFYHVTLHFSVSRWFTLCQSDQSDDWASQSSDCSANRCENVFFDSWLIAKRRRDKKGIQCFLVYFMCLLLCYLWRLRCQCTKGVETSVMAWLLAVYLLMTMLMIIVYMCKYRTVA